MDDVDADKSFTDCIEEAITLLIVYDFPAKAKWLVRRGDSLDDKVAVLKRLKARGLVDNVMIHRGQVIETPEGDYWRATEKAIKHLQRLMSKMPSFTDQTPYYGPVE